MAVFDGPGLRTTVFFKGCPLRCAWCHNPEGLCPDAQLMVSQNGCLACGKCVEVCAHPDACQTCGRCVVVCPVGLRRIVGRPIGVEELAQTLLKDADYLRTAGGGFTLSGGEPTYQPQFMLALLRALRGSHRAVETSGLCSDEVFRAMLEEVELVILDLKLMDDRKHREYTGVSNAAILRNLEILKATGKPFVVRIPVIPGVNDDDGNLHRTALALKGAKALQTVELLPYHKTAGAKYVMVGLEYKPGFETEAAPRLNKDIFTERGVPCAIL